MVPVNALEAATGTFVGHAWNDWVAAAKSSSTYQASWEQIVGNCVLAHVWHVDLTVRRGRTL